MKKIIIDVLGGDNAPIAILDGVGMAAKADTNLRFVLVGDEAIIKAKLQEHAISSRAEIIHTTEVLTNDDAPTAVRTRPNTSIALCLEALKTREDITALVSAGSTGAVLAGSVLKLGRIPGVSRPALCPIFPTLNPKVKTMVADIGANMDCRPEHLLHFALMANEYMKSVGVANPRVALLNVGTEDKKGNELTHAAFELLKKSDLNFVGNMEAREAFSGDYDVLVCDGFVGNILLKTAEGAFRMLMTKVKSAMTSSRAAKMGAILCKKQLMQIKAELSEEATGGSLFLGTTKPVIKAHGNSNATAFCNAILLARGTGNSNLPQAIADAIARNTFTHN